jgi:hypothetical protein
MEEEIQAQESRIPRWALIAGVVVVFLCLAALVALFLARTQLLSVAVGVLASETPTPSDTVIPTETFTPRPTDTEAPTLQPSETPTPTQVPMPPVGVVSLSQGGPVLADAFADNANGWQGINQTSEVIIQENQLQLRSADPGAAAVGYCQSETCGPYEDFYYVQAEIVEDRPSTLALGLVFAMNQPKSGFYIFNIRPASAEFNLIKFTNGQFTRLLDWTPNPAVKFYPFVNKLGATYQEGNIQLYANGVLVGSFVDKQPFTGGRIGFAVESDGVRLLASNVMVMTLAPVTPTPPSTPGSEPQPGVTQPATYQSPTPAPRFTATPTEPGSCPSYVPSGNFVLIVFKTGTGKGEIKINGNNVKVNQGNNVFYLPLDQTHVVVVGNRTVEYLFEVCKIVNLKLNQ